MTRPIFANHLVRFLACEHLAELDRQVDEGVAQRPFRPDPTRAVLEERGRRHEAAVLEHFRTVHGGVTEIPRAPDTDSRRRAADATVEAMRRGEPVIYQGVLIDAPWGGNPDFLVRFERPSQLGGWGYEVVDAKLARSTKVRTIIQLVHYSLLLEPVLGRLPEATHVVLGDGRSERHRVADFDAFVRRVRADVWASRSSQARPHTYPEPVEFCDMCEWLHECDARWRADDHLSLVAGIRSSQRQGLRENDVVTVEALAAMIPAEIEGFRRTSLVALERIREQARIQVAGRRAGAMLHELVLPVVEGEGFSRLPAPSPGDVFLDLEGAAYAYEDGLEYLIGLAFPDGAYHAHWARTREEERRTFEDVVDLIAARHAADPNMHVYHFAPYEPTAFKRLMGLHATREAEVDGFLRAKLFVDLHRVVRQSIRASVESYSLKKIEPLFGYRRDVPLGEASASLRAVETAFDLGNLDMVEPSHWSVVERYNRDDCVSLVMLREWLERQRVEAERVGGTPIGRPPPSSAAPPDGVRAIDERTAAIEARLLAGVPAERQARTAEQHARWLLAQLLDWHRREAKSSWWEYFRLKELPDDELVDERNALGGLEYVAPLGKKARSIVHRFAFPEQECSFKEGDRVEDPRSELDLTVVAISEEVLDAKTSKPLPQRPPSALVLNEIVGTKELAESLLRLGDWIATYGVPGEGAFQCARDLLLASRPRLRPHAAQAMVDEQRDVVERAVDIVLGLQTSVLPIQGPPGAGKTHAGARMLVELVKRGRRVGITANSHKVITNLLENALAVAVAEGVAFPAIQKCDDDQGTEDDRITTTKDPKAVAAALAARTASVAAGTAWLWARADLKDSVDVLFVDEAGQMCLADVLAVSQAAGSVVLLGDPQQLEQPRKGTHPPGVAVSALEHVLDGAATMPFGKGLFLPATHRLSPATCGFTSEIFYEGRLHPAEGCERQVVESHGRLSGAGLRFLPVPHEGNSNSAPEEVAAIASIFAELIDGRSAWIDRHGRRHPLGIADILVVAPYNAQVARLKRALPPGARVGTVDKFQGQQAPIVIYSMTSSSARDAPRGMEFLYSLNRFNVATSRARCLVLLVASPQVARPSPRTPRQVRLANALCGFLEMATVIS